jgi:hypothetical protein
MRKLLFLLLVLFLLPLQFNHAQLLVIDPIANAILEKSGLDQVIHYAQQVMEWVETANRFQQQLKHWKFQVDGYIQNIKSAGDIRSYKDFTNWYNRQLSIERKAVDSAKNANIEIGNKNYSLFNLEGIADAVDGRYIDYWNNEFTDEQRRAVWLGMGLTPSNYAYVQPFREKARELSREAFFTSDIQNEWYVRNMERNNERQKRLARDKTFLPDGPDKMGELEVLQLMLESSMENNKVLNDIAMNQAYQMEMQAAEYYLNELDYDAPVLSDWSVGGFGPLEYNSKR